MKEIYVTQVNLFLSLSRGPEDTCFEYGVFPAILSFPLDYPLSPPKMRFTCEMFHPNSESAAWGAGGFYTINKQLLQRESRHPDLGMSGALPVCSVGVSSYTAVLLFARISLFVTLVLVYLMMLNCPVDSNSSTALKIIPGILVTT